MHCRDFCHFPQRGIVRNPQGDGMTNCFLYNCHLFLLFCMNRFTNRSGRDTQTEIIMFPSIVWKISLLQGTTFEDTFSQLRSSQFGTLSLIVYLRHRQHHFSNLDWLNIIFPASSSCHHILSVIDLRLYILYINDFFNNNRVNRDVIKPGWTLQKIVLSC